MAGLGLWTLSGSPGVPHRGSQCRLPWQVGTAHPALPYGQQLPQDSLRTFPPRLLPLGISHLHEHIYFPFILGFVIKHEFNLPKHIYQRSKVSILSKEARQKSGIHTPSAAGVFSFPA